MIGFSRARVHGLVEIPQLLQVEPDPRLHPVPKSCSRRSAD
jgi:hypothetical protein